MRPSRVFGRGRMPLRVRLVAAVLVLVVAALVGSGIAATATMRSYLVGRVDDQLPEVAERSIDALRGVAPHGGDRGADPGEARGSGRGSGSASGSGGDGRADDDDRRLPSAYVIEVTDASGTVVYGPSSNLVDTSQPLPRLPRLTAPEGRAAGHTPYTVEPVSGDGAWRALATPVRLSDGSAGTVQVAQSLAEVDSTIDRLTLLLTIIGAAAVAVLAAAGYLIVRSSLRPLRNVETTAAAIAAGDLSHRVPDAHPRTEVGRLASSLNTMLAEIETAFAARAASEERMRRFVADAGHELRTPLASIRGFAELYRQGAAADERDVRRWMTRIEAEATRMGLLVEDLLLLARLDQERPLDRAPVDLLALAGDAVHDARAVAPDRPVRLEVGATDPPPIVIGDDGRLRQVLANLIDNALRHTPPGTPVTVSVSTSAPPAEGLSDGERSVATAERSAAVLEVSDEGPGLPPDVAARVFERFYRADAARARGAGSRRTGSESESGPAGEAAGTAAGRAAREHGGTAGTGLGLSIVAAIVAGHRGSVDVRTRPGAGASFRVELPLADTDADAVADTDADAVADTDTLGDQTGEEGGAGKTHSKLPGVRQGHSRRVDDK